MSGHEERIDLALREVVVVRVDAQLEPPIVTFTDTSHTYRSSFGLFLHRQELLPGDFRDAIELFAYRQGQPAATTEESHLMG